MGVKTMDGRLKEIKERFTSTTYGHWKIYENEEGTCIGGVEDHPQLKYPAPVVTMGYSKDGKKIWISKANAEFIAHSKEDVDWLIKQAELTEQIKGAYEDRVDDIDSLEKIITGIKEAYESKDENTLDEHLHDLFTNQLIEDY